MGKRVTVVLDEDLMMKIRGRQSKLIKGSIKAVSFSRVLNDVVREGLKKS